MSKLIIVESPAKCKKIESFLGSDYTCLASYGHITCLPSLKNINFENYKIDFEIAKEKSKQISKLRAALKKSNEVILATDDDREGEAIAYHLCSVLKLDHKTTKRIIFNEITKTALEKAIRTPTIINMNIVHAQNTRQILDLLIGFKFSPVLWEQISRNNQNSLSAGRCQTPALRIIYENQKEYDTQEPCEVYSTIGYFTSKNIPFELNKNIEKKEDTEIFLEESVNHDHILTVSPPKEIIKPPPIPLITSSLQQQASNNFHWSPKETMSIAQKLYENGYITYMRTDSKKYSEEFVENCEGFIQINYGNEYVNDNSNIVNTIGETKPKTKTKTKKDDKKVEAQEAHEAIRPTKIELVSINDEKITNKEKTLYKFIRNHTLKTCMSPAKLSRISCNITSPLKYNYIYNSDIVTFKGWKIVDNKNEDDEYYHFLPLLNNKTVDYNKIKSKVSIKNLKQHLTEAKLISILEEKGIGRPSTYSNILEKNKDRGYIEKTNVNGFEKECIDYELVDNEIETIVEKRTFNNENNKLIIKPLGTVVFETLNKYFSDIFNYEYTEEMEKVLDDISKGNIEYKGSCNNYKECIENLLKEYRKSKPQKTSFRIDENHEYMFAKHGPVIKCTIDGNITFKSCKKDINIEKIENGEYTLNDLLEEKKERLLGKFDEKDIILKNGKFGPYINYNDENISVKKIEKTFDKINISDVIDLIGSGSSNSYLRKIDDDYQIRKGKGSKSDYIMYKTIKMKKPQFITLKKFEGDYINCDIEELVNYIENNKK
jgi:DNA topoisomerase-1